MFNRVLNTPLNTPLHSLNIQYTIILTVEHSSPQRSILYKNFKSLSTDTYTLYGDKVFKNGPRLSSINFTWSILEYFVPHEKTDRSRKSERLYISSIPEANF